MEQRYLGTTSTKLVTLIGLLVVFGALGAAAEEISITSISHPSRVTAGQTVTFDVTVKNTGDEDADSLEVRVDGFGLREADDDLTLNEGETATFSIDFQVPTNAGGTEPFDIEARAETSNGNLISRDTERVDIRIDELIITLSVTPEHVVVGEPVEISGMASARDIEIDLLINGVVDSTFTTSSTRDYSIVYVPDEEGFYRIQVRSGTARTTKYLRVLPEMGILQLGAPETTNTDRRFDVCADLFRSTFGEVDVALAVDGDEVDDQRVAFQGEETVCFTTRIAEPGDHGVTVTASSGGVTDTVSQQVRVIESRIEVNVFPQQLTLTTGESGLFQIQIENENADSKTFTIDTTGLSGISEATRQTIALAPQSSETAFVRVVPQELGETTGRIVVTADGELFADTAVTIRTTSNPKLRNPTVTGIQGTLDAAGAWIYRYRYHLAAAIILLAGAGAAIFLRRNHPVMTATGA